MATVLPILGFATGALGSLDREVISAQARERGNGADVWRCPSAEVCGDNDQDIGGGDDGSERGGLRNGTRRTRLKRWVLIVILERKVSEETSPRQRS